MEKSCGGIIIKDEKVLMVRQASKIIGFPKGHTEEGETEVKTAIREIKEETNITAQIDENKRYTILYSQKPNIEKEVIYFIGTPLDDKQPKPQKGEIEEVMWVDIDKVEDNLSFDNIKEMWQKVLKDIRQSIE